MSAISEGCDSWPVGGTTAIENNWVNKSWPIFLLTYFETEVPQKSVPRAWKLNLSETELKGPKREVWVDVPAASVKVESVLTVKGLGCWSCEALIWLALGRVRHSDGFGLIQRCWMLHQTPAVLESALHLQDINDGWNIRFISIMYKNKKRRDKRSKIWW